MFERIKALKQRWADLKEASHLSDRDLEDLGMTRSQVEAFITMPHDVPDRVAAMAAIFGLSTAEIKADHDAYVDLLYTCSQCKDRKACRRMLDQDGLAMPQDANFCLNRHSFLSHTV